MSQIRWKVAQSRFQVIAPASRLTALIFYSTHLANDHGCLVIFLILLLHSSPFYTFLSSFSSFISYSLRTEMLFLCIFFNLSYALYLEGYNNSMSFD